MEICIEPVEHLSVAEIEPLVVASEREGWRFLRRLLDEWRTGQNRFARPGERLLSARSAGQLIGICGLNIDPYERDGRIGRVRRLYVSSDCRRGGAGRRLVEQVVRLAQGRFDELRLRTESAEAAHVYEGLGFQHRYGEANYTHVLALGAYQAEVTSS